MPRLDDAFGIHAVALKLQAHRSEVVAANLANADTPGFQARDIDFRSVLQQYKTGESTAMRTTNARHITGPNSGPGGAELLYRTPLQPSIDGNTVDTETEKAAFMENAVNYQATLTFIDGRMKSLKKALTGGQ